MVIWGHPDIETMLQEDDGVKFVLVEKVKTGFNPHSLISLDTKARHQGKRVLFSTLLSNI